MTDEFRFGWGGSPQFKPQTRKKQIPCWVTHKPLSIPYGDRSYLIRGGNCGHPNADADVAVGLDDLVYRAKIPHSYPWTTSGDSFAFPIDNNGVSGIRQFRKLIDYLETQLFAGKNIHVGCIGGHGRTGMVLVALYAQVTGEQNAGHIVRETYCSRAVESQAQVNFLVKYYGIDSIEPRFRKRSGRTRSLNLKPVRRDWHGQ